MTQSFLGYEIKKEKYLYSDIKGYWLNSGVIWIIKEREIKIDDKISKDSVSVFLIPSELKEILDLSNKSFDVTEQIYRKKRLTPGMFPEMGKVTAIAHINGDIEIYYDLFELGSHIFQRSAIILDREEWNDILISCQNIGRDICKRGNIPPGGGAFGFDVVEKEINI